MTCLTAALMIILQLVEASRTPREFCHTAPMCIRHILGTIHRQIRQISTLSRAH